MIRNIKAIGLALVAVFAMSAVAASAAQAEGMDFTGEVNAAIEGGQKTQHVFSVQGNEVTCTEAHFEGEVNASPSASQTVKAKYGNCTAFGFIGAEVTMHSCDYNFTVTGTDPLKEGNPDYGVGSVHIECEEAGDSITIDAGPCTAHIPPQTVGGITYHALTGTEGNMEVVVNSSGIESRIESGFLCPLEETEKDTTGTYTGTTEMSGNGTLGLQMT